MVIAIVATLLVVASLYILWKVAESLRDAHDEEHKP